MRFIKTYNNVWNITRAMHVGYKSFTWKFNVSTIIFFFAGLLFMVSVGKYIPLPSFFDNPLIRFFVIPGGFAYVMGRKSFDDKKPFSFLLSLAMYLLRPKSTFSGEKVEFGKDKSILKRAVTTVFLCVEEVDKKEKSA